MDGGDFASGDEEPLEFSIIPVDLAVLSASVQLSPLREDRPDCFTASQILEVLVGHRHYAVRPVWDPSFEENRAESRFHWERKTGPGNYCIKDLPFLSGLVRQTLVQTDQDQPNIFQARWGSIRLRARQQAFFESRVESLSELLAEEPLQSPSVELLSIDDVDRFRTVGQFTVTINTRIYLSLQGWTDEQIRDAEFVRRHISTIFSKSTEHVERYGSPLMVEIGVVLTGLVRRLFDLRSGTELQDAIMLLSANHRDDKELCSIRLGRLPKAPNGYWHSDASLILDALKSVNVLFGRAPMERMPSSAEIHAAGGGILQAITHHFPSRLAAAAAFGFPTEHMARVRLWWDNLAALSEEVNKFAQELVARGEPDPGKLPSTKCFQAAGRGDLRHALEFARKRWGDKVLEEKLGLVSTRIPEQSYEYVLRCINEYMAQCCPGEPPRMPRGAELVKAGYVALANQIQSNFAHDGIGKDCSAYAAAAQFYGLPYTLLRRPPKCQWGVQFG
ncbi:uncharacterized protein EV422DRAFT_285875 [Fimicolochytrium jonesii]|uniref:uncharacterized protein n=1 Tax=Fimicolochytrium jonesii TaxID=1396493 RepID=UPI0022FF25D4|nr:uncharacterized protein EV422DRAFT_285875 [Fimicolochytrium jonesii]KAI8816502.1 hypothetical protein EV422DRAFT_285875 [Fimicolochytrium jonesii]